MDDLATMTADRGQLAIRARILAVRPTEDILFADLHALLLDFDSLPAESQDGDDVDDIGPFISLSIKLGRSPRPDFFDEGILQTRGGIRPSVSGTFPKTGWATASR
ncbi:MULTISPECIES: hypothetical protein [unclassified Mesorhizobium]|uniref:hypothetical protein n=1 Tax=unclassified Mesorhizobium TaxID=325217 RepID=UPI0012E379B9|nr:MULTISPECIES: hypothetical protein [unclassified Mesorhizobium]